jgi:stage V sporulation protein SpoVS
MTTAIRVTASSELLPLADKIAISIRRGQGIILQTAGPTEVDLAIRAIALARNYLAYDSIELCFASSFVDVHDLNNAEPAMVLYVDRPDRLFTSLPKAIPPLDGSLGRNGQ